MAIKPNTKAVIEYLQGQNGADLTAADVAELMKQVSAKVKEQFGVELEAEVKRIGEF